MIERGRKATLQWGSRVVRGPVTDVARVVIAPWDDEAVVKFNPRSGIDPEIDQWSASGLPHPSGDLSASASG